MKKILCIFFCFLSHFALAVDYPDELATNSSSCSAYCATWNNNCGQYYGNPRFFPPGTRHPDVGYMCTLASTCPTGFTLQNGICKAPVCTLPEVLNIVINGADKTATCEIPSNGTSSSSSSAAACTASQYFDEVLNSCAELVDNASDCASQQFAMTVGNKFSCHNDQPDNTYCDVNIIVGGPTQKTVYSCEPASPNSTSSAPSSASASSTASNTSQPSSASNSSVSAQQQVQQNCEAAFGSGNCALNTTSTPCPNSYRQNGITYCVTIPNSGSSSSSGSGSGSSASTGTGSGSSASAGNATASNCNNEPVCTGGDPIQCAFLKQMWINNCDGIDKKIDIDANTDNANIQSEFNDLIDNNQTALNSDGTIAGSTGEIDVSQYADMVANLNNAANQTSSGSCPAPRVINISLGSFEVSYDPLCQLAEGISYFVLLFFSLSGSLIIYRTVEKI